MPIRVMIADDHAIFRAALKALLEKERDIRVVAEAGTGFDTIKGATKGKVDVLILDISLPGLSGTRVAEAVLEKKNHLPIVVLTMHEDEYYLRELLRIGVRGYVLKKSAADGLLHAIRAAVRGEQYVDPAMADHVISSYVGRAPQKRAAEGLNALTRREQEVCGLLAHGYTNAEVAQKLFISERTVESHRTRIMAKLNLKSRGDLVRFAIENRLLRLR